jgi:hypothetical protein
VGNLEADVRLGYALFSPPPRVRCCTAARSGNRGFLDLPLGGHVAFFVWSPTFRSRRAAQQSETVAR